LAATVEAQLRTLGQLHTVDGRAALGLADHLDRDTISGAERSSMTKLLNEVMARVLRTADDDPDDDPVHILAQRAKAKKNGDEQAYAYWMSRWNALPPSVRSPNVENW
jgi:hypothetical protein